MSYLSLLEEYDGYLRKEEYWLACPFHSETKPSLSANIESGMFYCFGCKKKGWLHELIAEIEGISLSEAFKLIGPGILTKKRSAKRRTILDEKILDDFFEIGDDEYIDYLEGRGISLELARTYDVREGNMFQKGWSGRVVFPVRNLEGGLVSVEGRTIRENGFPIHYKWKGSRASAGLFGIDVLYFKPDEKINIFGDDVIIKGCDRIVFIVEGIFDLLSLAMFDHRVVAMGCSDLSDIQCVQLKKVTTHPVVILDGYSKEAFSDRKIVKRSIQEKLAMYFTHWNVYEISGEEDPNDLLLAGTLKEFMDEILVDMNRKLEEAIPF